MGADAIMLQFALAAALAVTFTQRLARFETSCASELLYNYTRYWA